MNKLGFKRKEQKETEENSGLAHRTIWCATGQCPVHQGRSLQTCHLRVSGEPLRYNSQNCPVCHRTVRCATGVSGVPAAQRLASATIDSNGRLKREQCADSSRRVRAALEGAQDSEQCLSGATPDCPVPQKVRAPTVETVRTLTVG
jgi:hypothetical protein